jgi:hypothetical protein
MPIVDVMTKIIELHFRRKPSDYQYGELEQRSAVTIEKYCRATVYPDPCRREEDQALATYLHRPIELEVLNITDSEIGRNQIEARCKELDLVIFDFARFLSPNDRIAARRAQEPCSILPFSRIPRCHIHKGRSALIAAAISTGSFTS